MEVQEEAVHFIFLTEPVIDWASFNFILFYAIYFEIDQNFLSLFC